MQSVTAAAFGKFILLGEHAVVYGVPALACGIDRGLIAVLESLEAGPSVLNLLGESRFATDEDSLGRAFGALLAAGSGAPRGEVRVTVKGELPPGMNLGFSAAAGVAVARALEARSGGSEDAVRNRADAWEQVFHGNPSGIDVAAVMHGGVVRHRRGEPVRRIAARRALHFCIGSSGAKPAPTKSMVEGVAALRARSPAVFQAALDAIEALCARGETALIDGDVVTLGELMTLNHMVLAGWMLSTEPLERLCESARAAGALGAKLTGAGGGGAMVALAGAAGDAAASEIATRIIESWSADGRSGFEVVVGARRD